MDAGSEGRTDQETATLRELQALQQAFTQLTFDEQRLFAQQAQATQQINEAARQAYQAQQANRPDYYNWALDQRARALAAVNNLQAQLGQIAGRRQELGARQQYLQAQLTAVQSVQRQSDLRLHEMLAQAPAPSAAPPQPLPPRRRGRGRLIWLAGLLVLVVVLASLGFAWHLKSTAAPATSTVKSTPSPIT